MPHFTNSLPFLLLFLKFISFTITFPPQFLEFSDFYINIADFWVFVFNFLAILLKFWYYGGKDNLIDTWFMILVNSYQIYQGSGIFDFFILWCFSNTGFYESLFQISAVLLPCVIYQEPVIFCIALGPWNKSINQVKYLVRLEFLK